MVAPSSTRLVLAASRGVRLIDRPPFHHAPTTGLADVRHYNDAVGRVRRLWVYTPPGYDAGAAYPVAYLLHRQGHPALNRLLMHHGAGTLDALIGQGWLRPCIVAAPLGVAGEPPVFRPSDDDDGLPCMHSLLEDAIPFVERTHAVASAESLSIAVVSARPATFGGSDYDVFVHPEESAGLTADHARFYRRLFWWTRQFRSGKEVRLIGVSVREGCRQDLDPTSPRASFYRCMAEVMPLLGGR